MRINRWCVLLICYVAQAQTWATWDGYTAGAATEPTFTEIQGKRGNLVSSGTTTNVTLTSAPTSGNAVICRVYSESGSLTVSTVKDGAGTPNSYTVSPSSPSSGGISGARISLAYLLNVPSGANATITATYSGTITANAGIACSEFHRSSGTWVFDVDAVNFSSSAVTTVTTPSISPALTGELVYGAAQVTGGQYFLTSGPQSPWTQDPAGPDSTVGHFNGAYILASSGSPAMNMNISGGSSAYNAISMAVK